MNLMIIDDHEIVRDGLSMLLQQSYCIDGRICVCNGYEAVKAAAEFPADLVMLDLSMPGGLDGMTILERLRKLLPDAKLVIFSMHADILYQKKAYEAGADGYLAKKLKRDDLIHCLDKILANQKVFDRHIWDDESDGGQANLIDLPLTKREKEVFILTVKGYSQKDIAERLYISVKTVENHRQNIGEKLGTQKRYDWVETARRYHVFQP